MKFDTVSDLHFDTWTDVTTGKLRKFVEKLLPDVRSDILVIAGDMGHSNKQTIAGIKYLKPYYKYIVVVAGNHDYYLIRSERKLYQDSFTRVDELKLALNSIDGVYFLDCDVVELDGTRFAGCTAWYDGKYSTDVLGFKSSVVDNLWENFADCRYMTSREGYYFDWKSEHTKHLEFLTREVMASDVIVTHHIPLWDKLQDIYKSSPYTGFFHFDGYKILENPSCKAWVYGHTHDQYTYDHNGCLMVCNPLGYDGEFFKCDWGSMRRLPRSIKTVEI